MILNFWNSILLVGILQGFITTVLLFRTTENRTSNRLLAWVILFISLACLNIFLLETLKTTSSFWHIIEAVFPMVIIMPIGPLIYFYTNALLYPDFSWNKKKKLHLLPVLLDLVPYVTAAIYIIGVLTHVINPENNALWGNFIDGYTMFVDIPRWISLSFYLWLIYKAIQNAPKKTQEIKSYPWAKKLFYGFFFFQIIWLVHLILYILPSTSNILLQEVGWYPIYIPLMVMVYWLGINGYLVGHRASPKKMEALDAQLVKETISALETAMLKKQLFLDASLKLRHIAQHTAISQKVISAVLNQHVQKGFNEYVNEFRVEEFKKRLLNANYQHLTITGIAFECGFNSQATFQRSFKLLTNQSPKEFRQANLQKKFK